MLGYAYDAQKMALAVIEEDGTVRKLSAGRGMLPTVLCEKTLTAPLLLYIILFLIERI